MGDGPSEYKAGADAAAGKPAKGPSPQASTEARQPPFWRELMGVPGTGGRK